MDNIASIKNKISDYLEKKYSEKFIIAKLVSDNGELDVPNKVYVYPNGKEADWFAVRFDMGEDNNLCEFEDGYGFIFAEQTIFPCYQELILKELPSAKITVQIKNELEVTRSEQYKGVSFEEFAEKEEPFSIKINIFISDVVLAEKEPFFDMLDRLISDTPNKHCFHDYKIMFVREEQFAKFDASKCKGFELSEYKLRVKEVIAHTNITLSEEVGLQKIRPLAKP